MDFAFTADEERFRAELRAFLAEALPAWWRGMFVDDPRAIPFTRAFCQKLAARGWLTMSWPREWGGQEASPWKQTILREEMWAHDEPRGPQYMNLNYIGPCIMRFGTEAQKRRFLPPMAAGDVVWTQGFSESGAGSDLAAVATRADAHGDHFVVTGHKLWSSYADAPADWCFLLARTGTGARRHDGLSVLLVDMRLPGITVRPIDSMAGPHELNEVFYDDVRVPRDCLLGTEGHGWEIVTTGLALERVGVARWARAGRVIELLVEHVKAAGLAGDPEVRRKLAALQVAYEAARLLSYRVVSLQARGEVPGVEASIARLHNTQLEQLVGHVGLELLGLAGQLTADAPEAPLRGLLHRQWARNVPTTIAAGTLEVQKDIIARRGLGLPRAT
ncbi:MAG TPA: acyl-CoA dehydrogenase family protein [Candidatus Limnocylindria bacterium]|jgi:alkylation response protein AidB-like acyl-CoA dehydrogenase|nr:acyl-CoA dehydrogenase family protein [Candidatus Limnocylindria bacterium]